MRPRRKREQIPVFEGMEPRLLLSGTVLATAVGTTLTITGDQLDNSIEIANVAGAMQVTEVGGGKVVSKGNMSGIQNIIIRMRGGDDSVVLTSALSLSGRFMFDGGPGNNSLEDALGVQATGTVSVSGSQAGTAAAGDIVIPGSITAATFATGDVSFVQIAGVPAIGTIALTNVTGAFAQADITLASTAGQQATGTLTFAANLADGDTITLDDGTNTPTDFQAADTPTPGNINEFPIGLTAADTMTAFVAAVTAVRQNNGAGAFDPLNMTAQQIAGGTLCVLANTVAGVVGNTGAIGLANPATPGIAARITTSAGGMSGGIDPALKNLIAANNDTITLRDGANAAVVFSAVAGAPAAGTTQFQIGADVDETLENLTTAINAVVAGLTITAQALPVGGPFTSIHLTNDNRTALGNQQITVSVPADWSIPAAGMAGGLTPFANNETVTLADGQGHSLTFTGKDTLTAPPVVTEFLIDRSGVEPAATDNTINNLQAAINARTWNATLPLDIAATDVAAVNEVQTLTASAAPTAGQFIINLGAAATTALDFNATTGQVDAALEAIPAIGAGNVVSVTGSFTTTPFAYVVTFNSGLGDVGALTVTNGTPGLTAGAAAVTVSVAETTKGLTLTDANKRIALTDIWDNPATAGVNELNTAAASLGNIPITTSANSQFVVVGMAGGEDAKTTNVNDSITLDDGVNPAVTFVATGSPTAGLAQFGTAITAAQAAINFANAVNAYTANTTPVTKLLITAVADPGTPGHVKLTNNLAGAAGNKTIVLGFALAAPVAPTITTPTVGGVVTGMAGGANDTLTQDIEPNDFITIDDGQNNHPAVRFVAVELAPTGTSVPPVLTANEFAIGADAKATAINLQAAIAAFNQAALNVTATNVVDPTTLDGVVHVVNNEAKVHLGHPTFLSVSHLNGGPSGGMFIDNVVVASNGVFMDGTTVAIGDGTNTVIFTAKNTLSTNPAVPTEFLIGATAEATATNLAATIEASTLLVGAAVDAAHPANVIVTADNTGTAGNVPIVVVGPGASASGMSGGSGTGVLTAGSLYVYLGNGTPSKRGDNYSQAEFNGGGLVNLTGGTISGLVSITGGFGDDQVYLTALTVTGKTNISLGSGHDTLSLVGDPASTSTDVFGGAVTLNTGSGDDEIAIDACTFSTTAPVLVFAGLGDDAILIDPSAVGTKFNGNLSVFTGGGADVVTDSTATEYNAPVKGGVVKFIGVAKQGAILNDDGLLLGKHGDKVNTTLAKPLIQNLDGTGR